MIRKINKIIPFIILLCLFIVTFSYSQAWKDRIDRMNPVSNAVQFGEIFNVVLKAMNGDTVLFDQVDLNYGIGATDTTKIWVFDRVDSSDFVIYFNTNKLLIPDTVLAFTASTHDVASGKYGSFRLSVKSDSSLTITMSAAVYATRDSAYNAVPAIPAQSADLGYVVIYAVGALFDATTTKLNASTIQVYYHPAGYIQSLE